VGLFSRVSLAKSLGGRRGLGDNVLRRFIPEHAHTNVQVLATADAQNGHVLLADLGGSDRRVFACRFTVSGDFVRVDEYHPKRQINGNITDLGKVEEKYTSIKDFEARAQRPVIPDARRATVP